MLGTATLYGEKVTILDAFGSQVMITPGQAHCIVWVDINELTNIVWVA